MNEEEILIIIKEQDQTKNILTYQENNDSIAIQFLNKDTIYSYRKSNVKIRKKSREINLDGIEVFHKNEVLLSIKKVICFDDLTKVIYQNNTSDVFWGSTLSFVPKHTSSNSLSNVLEYFREISKYVTTESDHGPKKGQKTFLEREFRKLNLIDTNSVLYYYLSQKELVKPRPIDHPLIFPFRFNKSQKIAIENVFQANVSIIEGPPGTGKTQTILNIIANIIMQNKTVAVVSNNNEAVNNVRDKLKKMAIPLSPQT